MHRNRQSVPQYPLYTSPLLDEPLQALYAGAHLQPTAQRVRNPFIDLCNPAIIRAMQVRCQRRQPAQPFHTHQRPQPAASA